eukprot:TRINITY_DN7463_c0_g1_i2.p1 TRINITY_DN7463_c0_g1~~TRINITY_DN7463_c0_g1_i2.p1  ORF type:complete len:191 (-),score=61.53 TRINITY_DN7463_c0_g1_i2:231-803(-)
MVQNVGICVMGGKGKSTMVVRYIQGHYLEDLEADICGNYVKNVLVDGEGFIADVLDTSGIFEFAGLRPDWIRSSEGVILVYPIDASAFVFDELKELAVLAEETKGKKIPMLVVGTKLDLKEQRTLSTQQGQKFAKSIGAAFIEVSSKTNENVDLAFEKITRMILKERLKKDGESSDKTEKKAKDSNIDLP